MLPFIFESIEKQLEFGARTDVAICLGEGKNLDVLGDLNEKYRWFDRLVGLPHPRFVMQYRRKEKPEYIQRYLSVLHELKKAPRSKRVAKKP
jgi:hypothetical protein